MNNLFLLPVANTPADPAVEGQPPVEGPDFATVLEEVEQAEASIDLEEKITAAPDMLLVAVSLPPAPEPAQTPVPVQDKATEPERITESGSSANSNVEAAAVPRPQAYPQPASSWEMKPMTSQPPIIVQSPEMDHRPVQNPGIEKERAYTPIQENSKQPNPSPDLRPARQTTTPTNDPVQPPPQGSAPDVPPATEGGSTDGGGKPADKIGRNPTFPDAPTHGFSQEIGKEDFKPAAAPETLPDPESWIETTPKVGIRPSGTGEDSSGESGTPVKTAEHGPKQDTRVSSGERPYQQPPVLGDWDSGTVLIRQPTQVKPPIDTSSVVPANPDPHVMVGQAPEPVTAKDAKIAVDVSPFYVEKPQPRLISEYQGETGQTERLLQQVTAEQPKGTAQPTESQQQMPVAQRGDLHTEIKLEAASPKPSGVDPAPLTEDPLPRQKAVNQAAQPTDKHQAELPTTLQTPVYGTNAHTGPVRERPSLMPSPETNQPTVAQSTDVDGSHQSSPGEPSELPENQNHLPRQQVMPADASEIRTPSNDWPTYQLGQAAVSAGRLGTGPVLTHPLTSKPEAYPVNAPAEMIFPSEAAKLPEAEIPAKEMPKPAPIQTPTSSLAEFADHESGKDLAKNTDHKSAGRARKQDGASQSRERISPGHGPPEDGDHPTGRTWPQQQPDQSGGPPTST